MGRDVVSGTGGELSLHGVDGVYGEVVTTLLSLLSRSQGCVIACWTCAALVATIIRGRSSRRTGRANDKADQGQRSTFNAACDSFCRDELRSHD